MVPITTCQCMIPHIHEKVDVLLAIATSPNVHVFGELAYQGLLQGAWRRALYHKVASILLQCSHLTLLLFGCIRTGDGDRLGKEWTVSALILSLWEILHAGSIFLGY